MSEAVASSPYPAHFPLRKLDRDAPVGRLLLPESTFPDPFPAPRNYVYRFYDTDRRALYIGMTAGRPTRWDAHRKSSEWWPLAEYVAISAYRTYDENKEAERAALRAEKPRFNTVHVRGPANVNLHVHGTAKDAAAQLFREAMPEFIAELAALLAQPDLFPQPVPPPPARFAGEPTRCAIPTSRPPTRRNP